MKSNFWAFALTLCFFSFNLFAQGKHPKFGKVTEAELQLTTCPFDAAAEAFYLFDFAETVTMVTNRVELLTQRHFRIKVLNKQGLEKANHSIQLYVGRSLEESVQGLKAVAYNLENGKIVESKMEKDAIFKGDVDEHHKVVKFAVPNVRVGTVFEVQYDVISPFFQSVDPWYFQHDIPVQWSEYKARLYRDLKYRRDIKGYLDITHSEEDGGSADLPETHYTYSATNVPAFRDEPYLYTADNYLGKVQFTLTAFNSTRTFTQNFANTWGDVIREMMDEERFGVALRKKTPFKDVAKAIQTKTDPAIKMQECFNFIQNHFTFDGAFSIIASANPQKVADTKTGNSADINFALISLLRECGIEAYPVLLSSRNHGRIAPFQADRTKLNHVVAVAAIDSMQYFMDASGAFSKINMMPPYVYNGHALVVIGSQYKLIVLEQKKANIRDLQANLNLLPDGTLDGTVKFRFEDYGVYTERMDIAKAGSLKKYLDDWAKEMPGLTIKEIKTPDAAEKADKMMEIEVAISLQNRAEEAGNLLLLSPWIFSQMTENPFKSQKRDYPVEFNYPRVNSEHIRITMPAGYVHDAVPKNLRIKMSSGGTRFTCITTPQGNVIDITTNFIAPQLVFLPEQYDELKQFYQHVVDKEQEKIVLKKI
jgi:Transglutaminase-like superfamily